MKNITKSLIALLALVAVSCSVEDVQDRPVIEAVTAPVLTAPQSGIAYVLTPDAAANQAERFTWTSADFGGSVEVTYVVEIDKKGNTFKTPKELGTVKSQNQTSVSVEKLNTAVLSLGATPFTPGDFEVRVKSVVGAETQISNITGIVVTPYTTETPKLWVPGGYQNASGYGSDWTHSSAPTLLAEGYGKTAFEGYVYFATAQDGTKDGQGFKLSAQASWDGTNYGVGATAGTISATGGNLSITPGYYRINADTDPTKLTYTATATEWGVIGSATAAVTGGDGWGNDLDMVYDPAKKTWSVTMNLTANEIKFRANDAWTIDMGQSKVGADGVLAYGGDSNNIVIPSAGNYTIVLDLSSPRNYKYTLTKN
ncbi:MAG: SusE domain-containing protein [Flavobacterium sp.]